MNNQIELFKNQLENTLSISNEQFSKNLENQLNAEKLGYQNSSNETIFKGSNFIDDSFKNDLEILAIGIGHDVSRYYKKAIKITDVNELGDVMIEQLSGLFNNKH